MKNLNEEERAEIRHKERGEKNIYIYQHILHSSPCRVHYQRLFFCCIAADSQRAVGLCWKCSVLACLGLASLLALSGPKQPGATVSVPVGLPGKLRAPVHWCCHFLGKILGFPSRTEKSFMELSGSTSVCRHAPIKSFGG